MKIQRPKQNENGNKTQHRADPAAGRFLLHVVLHALFREQVVNFRVVGWNNRVILRPRAVFHVAACHICACDGCVFDLAVRNELHELTGTQGFRRRSTPGLYRHIN